MSENPMNQMAEEAMKSYQQAWQRSLKMQEEATRWWSGMWAHAPEGPDWQKRLSDFTALATGTMPLAQKRLEEMMEILERNTRAGAELMRKAADAAQCANAAECQAKWLEVWMSSLGAMRSNVEAINDLNAKSIAAWEKLVRQSTEAGGPSAAKAA